MGGGGNELSLRFIALLLHGLSCDFSVMSDINLYKPGNATAPPSSDSSVDNPPEARRKCITCPRGMSAKTADRHTVRAVCRDFDCSLDSRCEECIEWPDEEVRLYAKLRKSLKSKDRSKHKSKSSASSPPPADSVPSLQPDELAMMQTQVDSLNSIMNSLAESLSARLDALTASLVPPSVPQLSSQTLLGPDAVQPQPGQTAGTRRTFQALGVDGRTSGANVYVSDQGVRAPRLEQLGPFAAPKPQAAPGTAPPASDSFVPPQPPPRYGDPPPQPSTSGGGPSGPPPSCSTRDSRFSSESEANEAESDVSAKDSVSARLADLIYEVCPDSHPLTDAAHQPRCGFEGWFGQPEPSASRSRFRLYPRVGEMESEVAARAEALARRSKPLSQIIPSRSRRYVIADRPLFAASLAMNPSFAQLAGIRTVGSRCWGSITFSEMERLEGLFRAQLEMTSSSLWLMSGILAMLKRDAFQPTDPTLFNSALSSASATLSQQARSSSAGAAFLRPKRRESLLAHTSVPEAQRKALTVSPGSETTLFNEEILGVVVAQVQQSSLISFNLDVSRSLGRGRARSYSSSPLVDPSAPGSLRAGRPHGKRSSSSSRSGGRKRFRGGKGSAPSSKPSKTSLSRRPSSRKAYQLKWQVYRAWCHSHGHSVSRPSLSKVADFLCWLRSSRGLGVSSIRGYRSMLSAVFRFHLPSLSSHPVVHDLLGSFCLETTERQLRPPAWDLSMVLRFLNSSTF